MDEDDVENPGQDLARTLGEMTQRYTTQEAHNLARTTFDDLYSSREKLSDEEQAQMTQLEVTANEAREALKAARQRLKAQRWNESQKWFGLAAALGKPTDSGSFGESLGYAASSLQDSSIKKRDWSDKQELAILENELATGKISQQLAIQKLEAIKARRTADDKLMSESMRVLGRELRPGAGANAQLSPFGKQAKDEGNPVGSARWNRRVRELQDQDTAIRRGSAGLDTTEVSPQDTAVMAGQFGVPVSNVDPFRGMSTKGRQQAMEQSMRQGQQSLAALSDQDDQARAAMRQIDRFLYLNTKQKSGRLYGLPGINWLTSFSTAAQEMDSITADIARHQRQPGEGTVSNYDATQFLLASPSRGKDYNTNLAIGKAVKIAKQLQLERSEFMSNYLAVNRHLQGAKEAWNRYLNANTIFNPEGKAGNFDLNTNRVDYKTWFRQQNPTPTPAAPPVSATSDEGDVEVTIGNPADYVPAQEPVAGNGVLVPELQGLTQEQLEQATRPAFAKGGRVDAIKRILEQVGPFENIERRAMQDYRQAAQARVQAPIAPKVDITADSPVLRAIAARRQALLERLNHSAMTPRDAEQMQTTNTVLDTILSSPKPDINAGLRAEQFMRQLEDMASRYKKAKGGKVDDKEEDRSLKYFVEQLAREAAQGASYNFSDELSSMGDPEALREHRAALEQFGNEEPLSAAGAQTIGAIPTGVAAGYAGSKLLRGLKGKGSKTRAATNMLERVLPKSTVGKLIASGATSGAVAGAGAGQGDERGSDAVEQGILGGIFGPIGGFGSKLLLGGGRRGVDFLRGTTPSAADEKVLASMARDQMNLDDIPKRMAADQRMGVPTTIADVPGENTAALTEAVAGKQGEGPAKLAKAIAGRQGEQGERVENAVNKALAPSEYYGELQQLKDALYTNAEPLYQTAYKNSQPVNVNDVSFLYDTKEGKAALKEAVNLMRGNGLPIGKKDVSGAVKKLTVQTLDYTKRALDDMITKEEGQGANYVATNRGRMLRKMRDNLRDKLDAHSPDYKAARAQYAGDLEVLDALRMGKTDFGKLPAKQLAAKVANMSYAERDALRTGVAEHLFEQIAKAPRGSNIAARVVGNKALTDKLAVIFENPKEAQKFQAGLLKEYEMYKRSGPVLANARRARAQNASEGIDETPLANAADMALDMGQQAVFLPGVAQNTGGPWTTARILQWVRNRMPMSEKTANEIAETLGTQDPKVAKQVVERLKKEGERLGKRQELSDKVTRAMTRATAVSTAPDPWAQDEDVEFADGGKVSNILDASQHFGKLKSWNEELRKLRAKLGVAIERKGLAGALKDSQTEANAAEQVHRLKPMQEPALRLRSMLGDYHQIRLDLATGQYDDIADHLMRKAEDIKAALKAHGVDADNPKFAKGGKVR